MKNLLTIFITLITITLSAQEDSSLLSMLDDDNTVDYTTASFKTNRVINLHSLENTAAGVWDFKISHRFGYVNNGIYDLLGIDAATQRIGGDIGITDNFQVGFNRNSVDKAYDVYMKYRMLRQSTGAKSMPITLSLLTSAAITTTRWADPTRNNLSSSRLFYTHQMIVGRKFNDAFTLQLSPTIVHRNLVASRVEKNTVFAMGVAGRLKLSNRIALTGEYIWVAPNQLAAGLQNSVSIGFDIETGGHVFQLHFTNSSSMSEYGFITNNTGKISNGDLRFGFNVSRVFTLWDPKAQR
jgi:Membrane bound beta barrel domain (DUF5777)